MTRQEAISKLRKWDFLDSEEKEVIETLIPELKESEDEGVRKSLIDFLKSPFVNENITDEKIAPWLSWLDKRGEQKPADKVEPKFKVGDIITNKKSKDTVKIVQILHDSYCYSGWDGAATVHSDFRISEQDNWELVEHKPAWSEEDENGFGDALWAIQQARTIAKDENEAGNLWYAEKWLKSIKERVGNFDDGYKVGFSAAKYNHWKPSDEQMKQLGWIAEQNKDNMIGKELMSLYQELKKLKGE